MRCKGLEEQKTALSHQLESENKRREELISKSLQHTQEIMEIRTDMNRSLEHKTLSFMDSSIPVLHLPGTGMNNSRLSNDRPLASSSPFVTPVKQH